jgi:hypothetical protein
VTRHDSAKKALAAYAKQHGKPYLPIGSPAHFKAVSILEEMKEIAREARLSFETLKSDTLNEVQNPSAELQSLIDKADANIAEIESEVNVDVHDYEELVFQQLKAATLQQLTVRKRKA